MGSQLLQVVLLTRYAIEQGQRKMRLLSVSVCERNSGGPAQPAIQRPFPRISIAIALICASPVESGWSMEEQG